MFYLFVFAWIFSIQVIHPCLSFTSDYLINHILKVRKHRRKHIKYQEGKQKSKLEVAVLFHACSVLSRAADLIKSMNFVFVIKEVQEAGAAHRLLLVKSISSPHQRSRQMEILQHFIQYMVWTAFMLSLPPEDL